MPYTILEELIHYNDPGVKLIPVGLILHDTATPHATAQNEDNYFNTGDRGASAHYFVDWNNIIRSIPEDKMAWHALDYANHHFLSIELCDADTRAQFDSAYARYVWLAADICNRHHFNPDTDVHSHKWVSEHYAGNHQDPVPYLEKWNGKGAWDRLIVDIKKELLLIQGPVETVDVVKEVTASVLNIRSGPDTSYPIRYQVKKGQKIHLSKVQRGWAFTTYGALGGWVSVEYLTDLPKPTSKTPVTDIKPPVTPTPTALFRVRKDWRDEKSQIGAFSKLDAAVAFAEVHGAAYKVYDEKGTVVFPVAPAPDPRDAQRKDLLTQAENLTAELTKTITSLKNL